MAKIKREASKSAPSKRRRHRVPISCTICRRRKVKCDKRKPQCTNCIKNGVAHLCQYLEPTWAKPLSAEELKFPGARVTRFDDKVKDENERLKAQVKDLQRQNRRLRTTGTGPSPGMNTGVGAGISASAGAIAAGASAVGAMGAQSFRAASNADLLDCITASNVLFTAKRNPTYHLPIIYEISVFSWMFIVRNDSYLNDMWLKILRLRRHYEYYYSGKNAMADASMRLEKEYGNYGRGAGDAGVSAGGAGAGANSAGGVVSPNPVHAGLAEHTSKLKKFLDGTLGKKRAQAPGGDLQKHSGETLGSVAEELAHADGDSRARFKESITRRSISAIKKAGKSGLSSPAKTTTGSQLPAELPGAQLHGKSAGEVPGKQAAEVSGGVAHSAPTSLPGPPGDSRTSPGHEKVPRDESPRSPGARAPGSLDYNNTAQIVAEFERLLPTRRVVWLLVDRFFETLYLHLPYVDEESFRASLVAIIGRRDLPDQRIRLRIGTQYCEEFLTVCLALILIRLAWLSLPGRVSRSLTADELVLMRPENLVTMALIDMVKEVFCHAKILAKPSLVTFQVGLYLKFYNVMAPEDGFDLGDSFTSEQPAKVRANDLCGDLSDEPPDMNSPSFTAMLVSLARTIGLNRDPLNFRNFYAVGGGPLARARLFRRRHLWRKLWYGLTFLTIESNLSMGDCKKGLPIELDLDPTLGAVNRTWDTRLPGGVEQGVLEKSFYGAALEKEQLVVNNFRDSILVHHLLYRAMAALTGLGAVPTTNEIAQIMNRLLDLISDGSKLGLNMNCLVGGGADASAPRRSGALNMRTVRALSSPRYGRQVRVYKLRLYLVIKSMLFALNYLLFLNHEQKMGRLAERMSGAPALAHQKDYIYTYFESSLLLAIDNFNVFVQVAGVVDGTLYNSCAQLVCYPYLLLLNHRSHEFLISLILRLQQGSPIVLEILQKNGIDKAELLKRLFRYLRTFLDKLEDLTNSYYYAWRLKKMVKFFYGVLVDGKFSKPTRRIKRDPVQSWPQAQAQQTQAARASQAAQAAQAAQTSQPAPASQPAQSQMQPAPAASAFEIAFGTSKLPPVTDYADINNAVCEYYQQLPPDSAQVPAQPAQQVSAQVPVPSVPVPSVAATSAAVVHPASAQMNDVLGDSFFSGLPAVGNDQPADIVDGMPFSPALNNEPVFEAKEWADTDTMNWALETNGFAGSAYNSLNEIDFTNVDLTSQFDDVGKRKGLGDLKL